MIVDELSPSKPYYPVLQQQTQELNFFRPESETFAGTIREFIHDTNNLQKESGELNARLIKGEPVDIHDVMIAAEKAKTTFNLLLELRNKFTDMYREVMRMQV